MSTFLLTSLSVARLTFRICHRYDDVIVDYRINFLTLITFLSTLCRRQFHWYLANFRFCHHYDDVRFSPFQIAVEKRKRMSSRRVESDFHETQFLFSEGDIRESDADQLLSQPVVGKFVIPRSNRPL